MKNKIINLTQDLIKFKSDRYNEEERDKNAQYIIDYIRKHDVKFETKVYDYNGAKSYYLFNPNQNGEEIMLCGHIDVIPAEHCQYEPRIEGDLLFGRGAGDMKAGVAVLIELFMEYSQKKNITLLITTDEEIGGEDGVGRVAKILKPAIVLITEPSENKIITKQKGGMWLDINVRGPGGHASRPWLVRNAIDILMELIQEIKAEVKNPDKEEWTDTINIGCIKGGCLSYENDQICNSSANIIANNASVRFDLRLTENTTHKQILDMVDEIIKRKLETLSNEYSITKEEVDHISHLSTDDELEMVKKFETSYASVFGKVDKKNWPAASDGRFFSAEGTPVIVFGPISLDHHSSNERVVISSVMKAYEVLKDYLEKI